MVTSSQHRKSSRCQPRITGAVGGQSILQPWKAKGNQKSSSSLYQVPSDYCRNLSAPFFPDYVQNTYDAFGAAIATLLGFAFSLCREVCPHSFCNRLCGSLCFWLDCPAPGPAIWISSDGRLDHSGAVMPFVPGIALDKCSSGYHDQPYQLWQYEQDVWIPAHYLCLGWYLRRPSFTT